MDESACLKEWYNKKNIDVPTLYLCDERYRRYLFRVACWEDNENNYEYIRDKICEFIQIDNNLYTLNTKTQLMRYIDGEIMMMTLNLIEDLNI